MELVSPDDLPLIDRNVIRIIMSHQSILRDVRNMADDIDLKDFTLEEMKSFVKFCQDKTK